MPVVFAWPTEPKYRTIPSSVSTKLMFLVPLETTFPGTCQVHCTHPLVPKSFFRNHTGTGFFFDYGYRSRPGPGAFVRSTWGVRATSVNSTGPVAVPRGLPSVLADFFRLVWFFFFGRRCVVVDRGVECGRASDKLCDRVDRILWRPAVFSGFWVVRGGVITEVMRILKHYW